MREGDANVSRDISHCQISHNALMTTCKRAAKCSVTAVLVKETSETQMARTKKMFNI